MMNPPDILLQRLKGGIEPGEAVRERIRERMALRIAESSVLERVKRDLTPRRTLRAEIWARIGGTLERPAVGMLESIREQLTPPEELLRQLQIRTVFHMRPVGVATSARGSVLKWTAAFVAFAVLVRMSPLLFVASPTVAESELFLLPTRGEVFFSIGDVWDPVDTDIALEPGMLLKTGESETSMVLRDEGVVRLDEETIVRLDNLTLHETHITLYRGRIWLQGLISPRQPGIVISTTYGDIEVHEGSVSIAEDDTVEVEVYDRRATVRRDGSEVFLAVAERTSLWDGNVMLVKKIPEKWYQRPWAAQNLERDAVHRQDIAQLQQERLVAQAGILPTSPLYPVKRMAETVDVLFTFGEEARVQKKLQVAGTRLNEAAALLAEGGTPDALLEDYRNALAELGDADLAQYLVSKAVNNAAADVAAALPGDEAYILKKTVLEASRDLPSGVVSAEAVDGELLLDNLAVLTRALESGDTRGVQALWTDLQPYLAVIENAELALDPDLHKEAKTLLAFVATAIHEADARGGNIDPELLDDVAAYLPPEQSAVDVAALSEEEVMIIVQRIREKVFVYDMQKPRINQLVAELRLLEGHPDLGRILRRLAAVLPEGPENFPERIYKEIVRLRWQRVAEEVI